ncbi:hypothetical protein RvY_19317-3 [Ramazzottius varieornatus]|uniref:NADH:flavin oxidoreductase/NADH oxidase N-terminal domain-containing protein n=1 Tax=Ramazzottius varieornatus TaxID=947166 RepID=A0A1D1WA20_RAMVA|nr:hypothetical protein RvY_19317-3 [Ramazzottius varieornatus]
MCQYSAQDGFVNDWHFVHLGSRAVGGSGLLFTEATSISPEGRISPEDLGIWKDEHIPPLQRIVKFILAQNCVPAMQLAHAGRKASRSAPWKGSQLISPENGGWVTMGPSAIPNTDKEPPPAEMSREDITNSLQQWQDATARVQKAGFQLRANSFTFYDPRKFSKVFVNRKTKYVEMGVDKSTSTRSLFQVAYSVVVRG